MGCSCCAGASRETNARPPMSAFPRTRVIARDVAFAPAGWPVRRYDWSPRALAVTPGRARSASGDTAHVPLPPPGRGLATAHRRANACLGCHTESKAIHMPSRHQPAAAHRKATPESVHLSTPCLCLRWLAITGSVASGGASGTRSVMITARYSPTSLSP